MGLKTPNNYTNVVILRIILIIRNYGKLLKAKLLINNNNN